MLNPANPAGVTKKTFTRAGAQSARPHTEAGRRLTVQAFAALLTLLLIAIPIVTIAALRKGGMAYGIKVGIAAILIFGLGSAAFFGLLLFVLHGQ